MRIFSVVFLALALFSNSGEAQKAKKSVPAASLRGSKGALLKQNEVANHQDLTRLKDEAELRNFIRSGYLVSLRNTKFVVIDSRLDKSVRYARPYTRTFVDNLGEAYYKRFGKPIQVNSAVRTVRYQDSLRKKNRNATASKGPTASSHLTGATVDIRHKGMSKAQKAWVRSYLLERERKQWIEATEEKHQAVFHIMVFPNYGSSSKTKTPRKK
jgi:uncharacterized protein YcbK (DUF882 family)